MYMYMYVYIYTYDVDDEEDTEDDDEDVSIAYRTCSHFDPQAIEFLLRDPTALVRSLEQHGRTLGPVAWPAEAEVA